MYELRIIQSHIYWQQEKYGSSPSDSNDSTVTFHPDFMYQQRPQKYMETLRAAGILAHVHHMAFQL
jgi:hypothetical protein